MSSKNSIYIACVIVIPLTVIYWSTVSSSDFVLTGILFFILFPGMAVRLLIVPHGGTPSLEMLAVIIGAAVNIGAYVLIVRGAAKLWNKLTA